MAEPTKEQIMAGLFKSLLKLVEPPKPPRKVVKKKPKPLEATPEEPPKPDFFYPRYFVDPSPS